MTEVASSLEVLVSEGSLDDNQANLIQKLALELAGDDQMLDLDEFLKLS